MKAVPVMVKLLYEAVWQMNMHLRTREDRRLSAVGKPSAARAGVLFPSRENVNVVSGMLRESPEDSLDSTALQKN